jgi:hypothetical protein
MRWVPPGTRSARVSAGIDLGGLQVSGKQVVDANKYALQVWGRDTWTETHDAAAWGITGTTAAMLHKGGWL